MDPGGLRCWSGEATAHSPAAGVVVYQPQRGYRYAMDPFLLTGWVAARHVPSTFVDVGCGSGIMTLLLTRAGWNGVGLDVRPEWLPLARASAAASGLDCAFLHADVRDYGGPPVDLAVCNPPYFPAGAGPVSADPVRAHARHELAGTLAELVRAMLSFARRVALVLPADRYHHAVEVLTAAQAAPRRVLHLEPAIVLLEAGRGKGACVMESAPLRVAGDHSPRVRSLYAAVGASVASPLRT